jgi:hypothetical protein
MFFLPMYVVLFLLKKWVSPQSPGVGIGDWDHGSSIVFSCDYTFEKVLTSMSLVRSTLRTFFIFSREMVPASPAWTPERFFVIHAPSLDERGICGDGVMFDSFEGLDFLVSGSPTMSFPFYSKKIFLLYLFVSGEKVTHK